MKMWEVRNLNTSHGIPSSPEVNSWHHLHQPSFNGTMHSSDGSPPTLTTSATVKATILALMATVSLLGNSATLISILRRRKGRTRSSMYKLLSNLAVADLLVSIWCLSGEAAWTYMVEWKGGQILCKTFKFSQVFSLYLSTGTMVLIGFDRLRAIRQPINHQRSCLRPIATAWALSALLASPQLAIFGVLEGPFREPFFQCVTYGFYTEEWQEQFYSIFSLITMFIIPLVSLISCYACIFCTIARVKERVLLSRTPPRQPTLMDQFRPFRRQRLSILCCQKQHRRRYHYSSSPDPRRDIFQKAKMKSLRISIIIVLAFVICWTPYYFMMITFIFLKPDQQLGENLQSAIFFFGMSNSLVNPLIYGAFHLYRRPGSIRLRKKMNRRATFGSPAVTRRSGVESYAVPRYRPAYSSNSSRTAAAGRLNGGDLLVPPSSLPTSMELSSYISCRHSSSLSDPAAVHCANNRRFSIRHQRYCASSLITTTDL